MTNYTAKNLYDNARVFEGLAQTAMDNMNRATTQKDRCYYHGVAWAYLDCAEIIIKSAIELYKKD